MDTPRGLPRRARGISTVREIVGGTTFPSFIHPAWFDEFPWLVQGTTGAPFDLRLFGWEPSGPMLERWAKLRGELGMTGVAVSRQDHGRDVLLHRGPALGVEVSFGYDGHVTSTPGLLLAVTVADCVPVFLVEPRARVVGVLHAGWRGAARGILGEGLSRLARGWAIQARDVRVHLGPAICGDCYEVGPEVHEALGLAVPSGPEPVDVRAVLAGQAVGAGVPPEAISVSSHCTRCGDGEFFSHRGGDAGRQVSFLGIRG